MFALIWMQNEQNKDLLLAKQARPQQWLELMGTKHQLFASALKTWWCLK